MSPLPTRVLTLVALSAAVACSNSTGQTVTSTTVDPGEVCAEGGVQLTFGVDEDEDGSLTGDEVTSTQVLCNGETREPPAGTLLSSSVIEPGDECPYGGLLFEAGLDNGDGGGTADDGALQAGEVDTSEVLCNAVEDGRAELEGPTGPSGAYTLKAVGGTGTTTCGGEGGDFELYAAAGSGSIRVFNTGVADASFTMPTPTVRLGEVPMVVSADLTLQRLVNTGCNDWIPDTPPSEGDFYMLACPGTAGRRIFHYANSAALEVTGLEVAAGATLTLNTFDYERQLDFPRDVHLAGTLAFGTRADPDYAQIEADNFVGAPGSTIQGDGIFADGTGLRLIVQTDGAFVSSTTVHVSGTNGGDAGYFQANANTSVFNAGDIYAEGDDSTTNPDGGDGGEAAFFTQEGVIFNSGSVFATGGTGTAHGGDGGNVWLYGEGEIRNSGDLLLAAGDGNTACAGTRGLTTCQGGSGDDPGVWLYSRHGAVVSSGTIDTRGGTSYGSSGGRGGPFHVEAAVDIGIPRVELSGNIDTSGGGGTYGGSAGGVSVSSGDGYTRDHLTLYGYTDIDLRGGNGGPDACSGGEGGLIELWIDCVASSAPGGIVVEANVDNSGGAGDEGGWTDFVTMATCAEGGPPLQDGRGIVRLTGNLTSTGGAGSSTGEGGPGVPGMFLGGWDGVEVLGTIDISGADGADGGWGGYLEAWSPAGTLLVSGDIHADGGDDQTQGGDDEGSDGGRIALYAGQHATVSGDLSAVGGAIPGAVGGDGGEVVVQSSGSTVTGSVAVDGGSGASPGESGTYLLDGNPQ